MWWLLLLCTPGLAAAEPSEPADALSPTFKLNVTRDYSLPPAMYGTWSIQATILKSTAPAWMYAPAANEVWSLSREGGEVILRNVVNSATTSIHVDKVEGETATFHHLANVPSRRLKVLEAPTITVNGDHISGINRQTVSFYKKNGELASQFELEIKVEGTRLAGNKVTFGPAPDEDEPWLEIAPLQFEDD